MATSPTSLRREGWEGSPVRSRGEVLATARTKGGLGTMGMAISGSGSGKDVVPQNAPRLSEQRLTAATGSTIEELISSLLEGVRGGTMEVKERSVAALRSLADQSDKHAAQIAKEGLTQLIGLLVCGSTLGQVHTAATLGLITSKDRSKQVEVVSMGGIVPLIAILRSGSTAAQEQSACAVASVSRSFSLARTRMPTRHWCIQTDPAPSPLPSPRGASAAPPRTTR